MVLIVAHLPSRPTADSKLEDGGTPQGEKPEATRCSRGRLRQSAAGAGTKYSRRLCRRSMRYKLKPVRCTPRLVRCKEHCGSWRHVLPTDAKRSVPAQRTPRQAQVRRKTVGRWRDVLHDGGRRGVYCWCRVRCTPRSAQGLQPKVVVDMREPWAVGGRCPVQPPLFTFDARVRNGNTPPESQA